MQVNDSERFWTKNFFDKEAKGKSEMPDNMLECNSKIR